jgi:PIN domain nuclease of toxin-antitoxin system
MLLLDTCALVWWTLDPDKLSPTATRRCRTIGRDGALVSAMSLWELEVKIRKKKLDLAMSLDKYCARLTSLGSITIVPVDAAVVLKSHHLRWQHRDPADRMIVATAALHDAALVTADEAIRGFYGKAVW